MTPHEVDGVAVLDVVSSQTLVFAIEVTRSSSGWRVDGVDPR
ncbi:hypothetical protein [Cellulomonas soli]